MLKKVIQLVIIYFFFLLELAEDIIIYNKSMTTRAKKRCVTIIMKSDLSVHARRRHDKINHKSQPIKRECGRALSASAQLTRMDKYIIK